MCSVESPPNRLQNPPAGHPLDSIRNRRLQAPWGGWLGEFEPWELEYGIVFA